MNRLRIKILVQRCHHVKRLPIQEQLAVARNKLAKAKTSAAVVHDFSFQSDVYRVQGWLVRLPESRVIDTTAQSIDFRLRKRRSRFPKLATGIVGNYRPNGRSLYQLRRCESFTVKKNVDLEVAIDTWDHLSPIDVNRRRKLQPHALPDAGVLHVPVLLSVGNLVVQHLGKEFLVLLLVHRRIDYPDCELIDSASNRAAHVEAERRVAAFMGADANAINKHLAVIVHGAKLQ